MSLFESLADKFHLCGMDNLYTSAHFCKAAYQHEKKVLIHGVARKGGLGVPKSVLQEEVLNRNQQTLVQGRVKAAELTNGSKIAGIVVVSVYDTKPVHFLTTCCEKVQWKSQTRKIWDKASKKLVPLEFLRLNVLMNIIMAWAMLILLINYVGSITWTAGYVITSGGMQCFGGAFKFCL